MIPLDLVRLFIFDISPCKTGPLLLINYYKYSLFPTKQKYPNTSKEARQPVLSSIILSLGCFFSSFDKPSFLKFRLGKNHRPRKINLIMGKYQWKNLDEFAQSYIAWFLVSLGQMIHFPTVSCPFHHSVSDSGSGKTRTVFLKSWCFSGLILLPLLTSSHPHARKGYR